MAIKIKKILEIEDTYHNIKRFEEIVSIIFKYNLQNLIEGYKLPKTVDYIGTRIFTKEPNGMAEKPLPERVRLALEELGPTYVKMGQVMSLRNDIFPAEITEELTLLQNRVPPFDFETAKRIIQAELGQSVDVLFKSFDPKPIGSASLGQVHQAQLHSGEEVVVKIQRPNIHETILTDLEILMHLAEFAEANVESFKYRRPTKILRELSDSLERELDYKMEESNILRFRAEHRGDDTVYFMDCYPHLSTKKVLTMEHIHGIKADNIEQLDRTGIDRPLVASRGVDCLLSQIFENGFFHADPHPGNIFVLPNNIVSFIDVGMIGRLNRKNRELMADFLSCIAKRQPERGARLLIQITEHPKKIKPEDFERELSEIIDRYISRPLKEVSFAQLFYELSNMLVKRQMIFPSDFSMMLKAIATVEGLGRKLDPEINLTNKLGPYFVKLKISRLNPSNVIEDADTALLKSVRLLNQIPSQLDELLDQSIKGEAQIRVEHRGNKSFYAFGNQLVNRLSFALMLSALLISSSIMVLSGIPPKMYNIPVIGLAGFVIAGFMILRLLYSIWKKGMF